MYNNLQQDPNAQNAQGQAGDLAAGGQHGVNINLNRYKEKRQAKYNQYMVKNTNGNPQNPQAGPNPQGITMSD